MTDNAPTERGSDQDADRSLTPAAIWLGYAGLLPQILCVALAGGGHEYAFTALAGGFAYAAAIFSFLGGVWWGQAITSDRAETGDLCPKRAVVLPRQGDGRRVAPWHR